MFQILANLKDFPKETLRTFESINHISPCVQIPKISPPALVQPPKFATTVAASWKRLVMALLGPGSKVGTVNPCRVDADIPFSEGFSGDL